MLTNEDIKILSQLMDEKIKPINNRLDSLEDRLDVIEERLDVIEENTEITRSCTNDIIEWIDYNFHDEYPFPVKKIKTV